MIRRIVQIAVLVGLAACSSEKSNKETTTVKESTHEMHGTIDNKTKKPLSPHEMAMANVGANHVHIEYSSPGVRGRIVWGGLVPYHKVWVAGANNATSISFSKDVLIGDERIEAGKYAFFTIPGESTWTLIINKNFDQHLADEYDESEDLVRVEVEPMQLNESVEHLKYKVADKGNDMGSIVMSWDKIAVELPIQNL